MDDSLDVRATNLDAGGQVSHAMMLSFALTKITPHVRVLILRFLLQGWDQFKVNKERFGVESGYKEEYYTTTLDLKNVSEEKQRRAEKLAAEIEREQRKCVPLLCFRTQPPLWLYAVC